VRWLSIDGEIVLGGCHVLAVLRSRQGRIDGRLLFGPNRGVRCRSGRRSAACLYGFSSKLAVNPMGRECWHFWV
jgi:hypothetical protein